MTICTDTFIPYEYATKQECLKYIESRCMNIKKSLKRVEKTSEQLIVRCPLAGDYLAIIGEPAEVDWVDEMLFLNNWYRSTS